MDRVVGTPDQRVDSRSPDGLNISTAAHSGSHVTAPVLANNHITGNVQIIHNAPGFTGHHPSTQNERTQTSVMRSLLLKYKEGIRNEYQYVSEYNSLPGEHVLLSDRYIQPLIIQRHRDKEERKEEISSRGKTFQQVLNSRRAEEITGLDTFFNPDSRGVSPSAVILQGNSGHGKSFTVQKMMMDWASDVPRTKFDVVFHLKCKEISHISSQISLLELLSYSCRLTSDEISTLLQQSPERMLFLIDGFDELKITENINRMLQPTDLSQRAPPEVTLCALLKRHILRKSSLLVTTRSTAVDILKNVLKGPHSFTEIIGFSEKGVKEYFRKFFQDDTLFMRGYEYVRANETLLTACSSPVICWIICTVTRERFTDGADLTSGLETTTSVYVDFLCTLLKHHNQRSGQSVTTLVKSLGQLAEKGILAQQVLFDEKTVCEMVSYPDGSPFLCKLFFKRRVHKETMFSFMHLSFQEFFTALYYLLLDECESEKKFTQIFSSENRSDHSIQYTVPRFAAIVQFIFGLSNEDVRHTLSRYGLLVCSNIQDHLKKWIIENMPHSKYKRYVFFFHCLYELHEERFVKEVVEARSNIYLHFIFLERTDCLALLYCLQCCQCIEGLEINNCWFTSETISILWPVLHRVQTINVSSNSSLSVADLGDMMQALTRAQTLNTEKLKTKSPGDFLLTFTEGLCRFHISRHPSSEDLVNFIGLSFPRHEFFSSDWKTFFQMFPQSGRDALVFLLPSLSAQMLELRFYRLTKDWVDLILTFTRDFPRLTEINVSSNSSLSVADLGDMMQALTRAQTLNTEKLKIELSCDFLLTFTEGLCRFEKSRYHSEDLVHFISLSFPRHGFFSSDWRTFFQMFPQSVREALVFLLPSLSAQTLELRLKSLTKDWVDLILTFTKDSPSLTEINLKIGWLLEEAISILQRSRSRSGCTLTFKGWRCSKSSKDCTDQWFPGYLSCNQEVKIHLNKQSFSMETLQESLCFMTDLLSAGQTAG